MNKRKQPLPVIQNVMPTIPKNTIAGSQNRPLQAGIVSSMFCQLIEQCRPISYFFRLKIEYPFLKKILGLYPGGANSV